MDWLSYMRKLFSRVKDVTIEEDEPLIIFEPELMEDISVLVENTDPV